MPLFISNFKQAAPPLKWLQIWAFAIALTLVTILCAEFSLRKLGHHPSIVDDLPLWAQQREKVQHADNNTIVLIGASRMQTDISMPTFHAMYPNKKIIQLAIDGRSPIATLNDLANDQNFTGTVLCAATALTLLPQYQHDQQSYVDYYHRNWHLNHKINRQLATFFQSHWVIANPHVKLASLLGNLVLKRQARSPSYVTTYADRSRQLDYQKAKNLIEIRQRRLEQRQKNANFHLSPKQWFAALSPIVEMIRSITNRGGKVVLIHLPITSNYWLIAEKQFPKKLYWDQLRLAANLQTIHFKSFRTLSQFNCPDTSHLDYRDTPLFTLKLIEQLVALRILPTHQH